MNNNRIYWAAILLASLFFQQQSQADENENGIYLGVNYSVQSYKSNSLESVYNPTATFMRMGVNVSRYFAFEGRYGVSTTTSTKTQSGNPLEIADTSIMGMYVKPRLKFSSRASVYGLLGASYYAMEIQKDSTLQSSFAKGTSGISVGAGLESFVYKSWAVNAEILTYSLQLNSKETLYGMELGAFYQF